MKILVEIDVPDEEDCYKCRHRMPEFVCSIFHSALKLKITGKYPANFTPCSECLETRKRMNTPTGYDNDGNPVRYEIK